MPSRRELANAVRALSMDAVQKANSGHPGAPMGMADIAEVLWNDFFRHNPGNPKWHDRDRFVMSNGHGSMLVYSVLHLTGYDLPMDEIRNFRQLHSMTPGHPEYGYAPGVETTTGPLGQGLANAVGMALGEKMLAARYNQPGYDIVDHFTYVFMGDGCLMEGISHEACSLAGTLGLGKLIAFYDDNGISIDGEVDGWFTDDTPGRFEAYGWHVVRNVDGHDPESVKAAIEQARAEVGKPSIICCKTVIGFGSPNKKGTAGVHGAALGEDEVALARKALDWPHAPFEVPDAIRHGWDARSAGQETEDAWRRLFESYRQEYPEMAAEYQRRMSAELPGDWEAVIGELITTVNEAGEKLATRKASGNCLDVLGQAMPELVGGSADLSGSNNTQFKDAKTVTAADPDGNYIYYGVREFAMSAMVSGLALHGGFIPYAGTFLTFSDYARNAVRMAALMKLSSIYVYTHDSIGLGEDGPTHQSVEHLASLRLIPNMTLWRPCDTVETAVAWQDAIERCDGPTLLALSRQGLPFQARDAETIGRIRRGGYVLSDSDGKPDLILIGTGSEVALCTEAADELRAEGLKVRVVSMPSSCAFQRQEAAYRQSVLPADVPARVAVEAGVTDGWYRWVGDAGAVVGLDQFGESAPAEDVFKHFGFTVTRIKETVRQVLDNLSN